MENLIPKKVQESIMIKLANKYAVGSRARWNATAELVQEVFANLEPSNESDSEKRIKALEKWVKKKLKHVSRSEISPKMCAAMIAQYIQEQ